MCWTCLSRWITAQLWPQWSSADTELCGKSAVRLMQQVRVYQSVLRKPQLAKCFTLRQSTENKAGRETYLCFHPFNYDSPTPPSPRTVPAGGCACGQRVAGSLLRWRTQPSPEVASRHLQVEPRPPPRALCEESIRTASNQLRLIALRQAGVKGAAGSCLGRPLKKASGQGWLFSLVFQAPYFGLQSGVSSQLASSLEAAPERSNFCLFQRRGSVLLK